MGVEVTRRDGDYELTVDGEVAGHSFVEVHGHTVVFTHTEIDERFEGRGLGSQLARAALDDVRSRGEHVIARCPFVSAWIDKHPDYQDLVQHAH
jgi:predicted GNAT family acetyltransferase